MDHSMVNGSVEMKVTPLARSLAHSMVRLMVLQSEM